MKIVLPIIFLISSCTASSDKTKSAHLDTIKTTETKPKIISSSTNTLTGKIESLELNYLVWGCACANWITDADYEKYQGKIAEHCIFIEPANETLVFPINFDPVKHKIKVKGQFYSEPDYPQGTIQTEEQLEKAKVFRYTKLEVVEKEN